MRQLKITKSITNRESASLDKYLQEIGREDLITVEEEVELAQAIKRGDRRALEKLTRANLRFVVSVAKQYQNQGLSLPDLINEGNLGLIKAAEKFDETRGFIAAEKAAAEKKRQEDVAKKRKEQEEKRKNAVKERRKTTQKKPVPQEPKTENAEESKMQEQLCLNV